MDKGQRGQGPENSKEIGNLQVVEEEQNTQGRYILADNPETGTQSVF